MHQFKALLRDVLDNGSWQENRTGIRTISVPGASARFDLTKGFPAVTTKKLAYKTVFGELCAFLRASDSARQFRDLGCKVWDQNANENAAWLANPYRDGPDDLGAVYGVQWRAWPAYKLIDLAHPGAVAQIADAMGRGYKQVTVVEDMTEDLGKTRSVLLYKVVDQLRACLDTIVNNPTDRRIVFHAWNPAVLEELALPACHLLYQFLPNVAKRELSMCLYIRSNDLGLGCPFNTAEPAALLELVARLTGYTARWLTIFIGDAHI